jgi:hypothetical protein
MHPDSAVSNKSWSLPILTSGRAREARTAAGSNCPYNVGLEAFVKAFTDLITSIMADVQKYGLKEGTSGSTRRAWKRSIANRSNPASMRMKFYKNIRNVHPVSGEPIQVPRFRWHPVE